MIVETFVFVNNSLNGIETVVLLLDSDKGKLSSFILYTGWVCNAS
jgi:hypothetical protein